MSIRPPKIKLHEIQENIDIIMKSAREVYQVDPTVKCRKLKAVWSRTAVGVELRKVGVTFQQIADLFNQPTPVTAMHGISRHADNLKYDKQYKSFFERFEMEVNKPKELNCPECLNPSDPEELFMFNGLCEECSGAFES